MLILKCMRPDKVTNAMQDFLTTHLGERFVEPQTTELQAMFTESSPTVPLVFVLSTGTDPAADLYKFADKVSNSFLYNMRSVRKVSDLIFYSYENLVDFSEVNLHEVTSNLHTLAVNSVS